MTDEIRLRNGVRLELVSRDREFLGIGEVSYQGVALRSGRRPMFVDVRTPDAVVMREFALKSQRESGAGVVLSFSMKRKREGLMEWEVHEPRPMIDTSDWTEPPRPADASLKLEIQPVSRTLGGAKCVGFSYQYRYQSNDDQVYKLLDRGTWELGGRAVGNEFWMRTSAVPPVHEFESVDEHYTTERYMEASENPWLFQFLPLQTELQGFTFTTSREGALITWPTRVAHVRSLFQKPRGKDEIVHFHEHCDDLASELTTAPVEVLFCPGKRDRIANANLYEAARDMISQTLHDEIGMRRERVTTSGVIEQWGEADVNRYAEVGLPKLLEAGMRSVRIANMCENNMNVWGLKNMCCTVDYKIAESVGHDAMKKLCRMAREGGARINMWANTAISTITDRFARRQKMDTGRIKFLPTKDSVMEMVDRAEDPYVLTPSRLVDADHYAPGFCVLNLRDPDVRAYWLKRWGEIHDDIGVDEYFLDSSFNLSSDKFHYRRNTAWKQAKGGKVREPAPDADNAPPAMVLTQYRAHLDLIVEMQKLGYYYDSEDNGVFGTCVHGHDIEPRLDCLYIWPETKMAFEPLRIEVAGGDADDVFFRGLAYRMAWIVAWDINADRLTWSAKSKSWRNERDTPTPWQLAVYNAFAEVTDLMVNREILPGEEGVVYRGEKQQTLWAFRDMTLALDGEADIRDVLNNAVMRTDTLQARARHIYVIEKKEGGAA